MFSSMYPILKAKVEHKDQLLQLEKTNINHRRIIKYKLLRNFKLQI